MDERRAETVDYTEEAEDNSEHERREEDKRTEFPSSDEVVGAEDRLMVDAEGVSAGRRVRRWRSIAEKRQIVQLTMASGASVAEVARAHGVNANQVFKWRRAFERGDLIEPCAALIPVTISSGTEAANGAAEAA
jgi:hypothetical protein